MAHLGAVVAGATLKSTGSIVAVLTTGATGVSVGFNVSTGLTQNSYLLLLEAAIEHANGHASKITVTAATGVLTLTQVVPGTEGNNPITDNMTQTTIAGFSGGYSFSEARNYNLKLGLSQSNYMSNRRG